MEYVPHGKLQSFLRNSRAERYYGNLHGASNTLTSQDLTSFVYQVARGMDFLSSKGVCCHNNITRVTLFQFITQNFSRISVTLSELVLVSYYHIFTSGTQLHNCIIATCQLTTLTPQ
jgi:serine/threonine protein kinase